jgi:hypothetical protein
LAHAKSLREVPEHETYTQHFLATDIDQLRFDRTPSDFDEQ